MENELLFITEVQREELVNIYHKLKKIESEINSEYEEFPAIKTGLYSLNNAINYKAKNF